MCLEYRYEYISICLVVAVCNFLNAIDIIVKWTFLIGDLIAYYISLHTKLSKKLS